MATIFTLKLAFYLMEWWAINAFFIGGCLRLNCGVEVVDLADSIAMKFDGVFTALVPKEKCFLLDSPTCFVAGIMNLSITCDEVEKLKVLLD